MLIPANQMQCGVLFEAERYSRANAYHVVSALRVTSPRAVSGEEVLAACLTKQADKGRLSNEDTHPIAQHFMSLIAGGPVRWFVLAFDPSSLSKRSRSTSTLKIQVFMRAYGRIRAK